MTPDCTDSSILIDAYRKFNLVLKYMSSQRGDVEVIEQLTKIIEDLFPSRIGSVLLVNEEKQTLHLSRAANKLPAFYNEAIDGALISPTYGSCGAAAYLKKLVIVANTYNHPNWKDFYPLVKKASLRACWSMPILSKDNTVLGTFAIYSREISEPHKYELEILETAAFVASVALDKVDLVKRANMDKLTELNNRESFKKSFEYLFDVAVRQNQVVGLVFIDLNKFKIVNDCFGHEKGDEMLVLTANILRKCLRKTDIVCRHGGDEFIFAAIDMTKESLEYLCQRISEELIIQTDQNIKKLGFGISFGGILVNTISNITLTEMIRLADTEMYHSKRSGELISINSKI